MEVQGQLACPRIEQKHKQKSCELYMCPFVHTILCTHDVYLYKSVKIPSCKGRVVHVKYESLGQTTCCWVGQNKYNRFKKTMTPMSLFLSSALLRTILPDTAIGCVAVVLGPTKL